MFPPIEVVFEVIGVLALTIVSILLLSNVISIKQNLDVGSSLFVCSVFALLCLVYRLKGLSIISSTIETGFSISLAILFILFGCLLYLNIIPTKNSGINDVLGICLLVCSAIPILYTLFTTQVVSNETSYSIVIAISAFMLVFGCLSYLHLIPSFTNAETIGNTALLVFLLLLAISVSFGNAVMPDSTMGSFILLSILSLVFFSLIVAKSGSFSFLGVGEKTGLILLGIVTIVAILLYGHRYLYRLYATIVENLFYNKRETPSIFASPPNIIWEFLQKYTHFFQFIGGFVVYLLYSFFIFVPELLALGSFAITNVYLQAILEIIGTMLFFVYSLFVFDIPLLGVPNFSFTGDNYSSASSSSSSPYLPSSFDLQYMFFSVSFILLFSAFSFYSGMFLSFSAIAILNVLLTAFIFFNAITIIYAMFKNYVKDNAGTQSSAIKALLYIPMFFYDMFVYIFRQLKWTSNTVYILFIIEIMALLAYLSIPKLLNYYINQNANIVLPKTRFLDIPEEIGTSIVNSTKTYTKDASGNVIVVPPTPLTNYSISMWIYLNPQPINGGSKNEYMIFHYGNSKKDAGSPKITYSNDMLSQTSDSYHIYFSNNDTQLPYKLSLPKQTWNQFVFNYTSTKVDLFINGEIKHTHEFDLNSALPTYTAIDTISIGQKDGLYGAISNIKTYTVPMTQTQIFNSYTLLMYRNPPEDF